MFHKFPKITNIGSTDPYEGKYINTISKWVATEKIDGCNISIIIDENRNVTFAGRTQEISDTYNIYNLRERSKDFKELVDSLINIANINKFNSLNVFGEYFGLGIQDRIFYSKERNIRIYTALVNDTHWLSFNEFINIFGNINNKWLIPVLGTFDSWENAVTFAEGYGISNNLSSQLSIEPGEGVVLYPADKPIKEDFIAYKYKTDAFKESTGKSVYVKKIQVSEEAYVVEAKNILKDLVNLNRGYSVASKIGLPKNKSEIGNFLSNLVKDALEDAKLDFPEVFNKLSEKDYKKICNLGNLPYNIYSQLISKKDYK